MGNNNSYKHDFNQASENLRLVIPFLSQHKIPPSPENYRIAYDYVSGSNQGLTKAFDQLIKQQGDLTEQQLSKLYLQHIQLDDKALDSVRHALKNLIVSIQQNVGHSQDGLSDYLHSLNEFAQFLANTNDHNELTEKIYRVMDSTRSTEQSQRDFESQMSSMMNEVEILREQLNKARQESLTDPLTGLANRKAFDQKLDELITDYAANKSPFSLVIGDIDHFKKFNDTYGHLVGDRVLKYVGKNIQNCIKGKDLAARYGGEEFVMVLPETSREGAEAVAQQVCETIARHTLKNNQQNEVYGKITISLGVGEFKDGEDPNILLQRADKALYKAKQNGRNRVEVAH